MTDIHGPGLTDCVSCHEMPGSGVHMNGTASFASGFDANGDGDIELSETDVCDACHSPGGAFDGVDDPIIGAKPNWTDSVYAGDVLAPGKERWCAGCHDLGSSVVWTAQAPAVAGDDLSWGYFATGHGVGDAVTCTECHEPNSVHTDGLQYTYSSVFDNYQFAFRLKSVNGGKPLEIPRFGAEVGSPYSDPPFYELCLGCHDRYALFSGPDAPAGPYFSPTFQTNFRSDAVVIIADGLSTDIAGYSISGAKDVNSHVTHLAGPPHFFDSDHDGVTDSYGTCVACHNVHGSTSPAMVRDGKLIGHEPSLNFSNVRYSRHNPPQGGCVDPIVMSSEGTVLDFENVGGVMRSNSGASVNGVCGFCHCSSGGTGDPEYIINCYGPDCVDYYRNFVQPPPASTSL
jgi:predicted CXXCH cytochrome family protein